MIIYSSIVILFSLSCTTVVARDYFSYPENALCVFANAARFATRQFASDNGVSVGCSIGSNLGPLCGDDGLAEAARAHSAEMARTNGFDHNSLTSKSCNTYGGCGFDKRIGYYFSGTTVAENILAGDALSAPSKSIAAWVESPGHCRNLMSRDMNCVGHGVARGTDAYGYRSTQNLGKCSKCSGPIVCGAHIPSTNGVKFIVAVYGAPNADVYVIINGESTKLALSYGNTGAGVYDTFITGLSKGCNTYSFEVRQDGSLKDRYPGVGQGSLQTNSYGSCTVGYNSNGPSEAKKSSPTSEKSSPMPEKSSPSPEQKKVSQSIQTQSTSADVSDSTKEDVKSASPDSASTNNAPPADSSATKSLEELLNSLLSNEPPSADDAEDSKQADQKEMTDAKEANQSGVNNTIADTKGEAVDSGDNETAKDEGEELEVQVQSEMFSLPYLNKFVNDDKDITATASTSNKDTNEEAKTRKTTMIAIITPVALIVAGLAMVAVFSILTRNKSKTDDDTTPNDDSSIFSPSSGFLVEDPFENDKIPMTPTSPTPLMGTLKRNVERQNGWKLLPSLFRF